MIFIMIHDLENLTDDELTRVERMLNINKMIQETNQNHEMNMATIAKMKAETEKISKETRFYPMLTVSMGIVAVIGGIVAAFITKFL